MSQVDALANLEVVTGAFLAALESTDPSASCADIRWTAAQLAAHLGGVHRWAAGNAREGKRGERANVPELSVSPVEWYSTSRDVLLETLRELDPDARCYTLSATDKSVRFSASPTALRDSRAFVGPSQLHRPRGGPARRSGHGGARRRRV